MPFPKTATLALLLLSGLLLSARAAEAPLPDAIAAPGETIVLAVHAEGAQVYAKPAPTASRVGHSVNRSRHYCSMARLSAVTMPVRP